MNEPTIRDGFTELGIFEKNQNAWTTSRELARVFGKEHFHVLRDIERILNDCEKKFGESNFGLSSYKTMQNKKQSQYLMTRKGFSLVAMGFTGKKAMEFKVAYIEAFEAMSELIGTRLLSKAGYKEMSSAVARNLGTGRYVFAEEANMVNRAVLGMTSKDFREVHNLKPGQTPRDSVVKEKLEQLDAAQRLNANLIRAGVHSSERQRILEVNYKKGAAV